MLLDAYNSFICNPIEEKEAEQIKQIKSNYKPAEEENFEFKPQVAVYYDVWANDNDEDPIISLIYAIIQSGDTDLV